MSEVTAPIKTIVWKGQTYIRLLDLISALLKMGHVELAESLASMKDLP